MLHSFLSNSWIGWREQIPMLVELGYRVIVPSFRGFGETVSIYKKPIFHANFSLTLLFIIDAPADPAKYGFDTVSNDLYALLDHLEILLLESLVMIGEELLHGVLVNSILNVLRL